jgi:hypothetical protein
MRFWSQVSVAHTCNPSWSGGRDQEDCGSRPAWANNSPDPILINLTKSTGGVVQGVGPEFKPQYCKKKNVILESEKIISSVFSFTVSP